MIDLQGKLVTAGINDAHIHFLEGSLGLTGVDLYACKSLDEAIVAIEKFAAAHPEKQWITGMGWQYSLFTGGMPDQAALARLNNAVKDRPVYMDAYDGHSIWVNSKVLEKLSKVPQIRMVHIGVPASTNRSVIERGYSVSWLLFFDSLEEEEIYQKHPIHLKFVEDYAHLWEKVIVYDSVGAKR